MKLTIEKKVYLDYLVSAQFEKDNIETGNNCINQDKKLIVKDVDLHDIQSNEAKDD